MTVTVIATTRLRPGLDAERALGAYLEIMGPVLQEIGVDLVSRHVLSEPVVGRDVPTYVTMLTYPSEDAVRRLFQGREYQTAIPHRDAAFERYEVAIYEADETARATDQSR